ncbi:MAG: glycoside hydrolase family 99-like domain-containing protein [Alphaproteobacteria bacterium]|nr:glycoside hydrolase family 99-like domain-containing protein [Alphaproteobacteria bacterium]
MSTPPNTGGRSIRRLAKKMLGLEAVRPSDPGSRKAFRAFTESPFYEAPLAELHMTRAGITAAQLEDWYWSLPIDARPSFSPYFDPAFYLARYPDIAQSGADPQLHFFLTGFHEARAPHPLIDLEFMAQERFDLLNPSAKREMLPMMIDGDVVTTTPYIDLDHCRATLSDAENAAGVLRTILRQGIAELGSLNPYLDPVFYVRRYPDVPHDSHAASIHYIRYGDASGRQPSDRFDAEWYINMYPDLRKAGMPPLYHYMRYGRREGRPMRRPVHINVIQTAVGEATASYQPLPERPEIVLEEYAGLKSAIAAARDARVRAVVETDLRVAAFDGELSFADLKLGTSAEPRLSIVVPVYNAVRQTFECLWSIMKHPPTVPYEVLLTDDASPDEAVAAFANVTGLRYLRQARNLGFLANSNDAYTQAKGALVLLLNSDTQVLAGALDALIREMESAPDIGAAGPLILYPNGRVQEAGCVIHDDGSTEMVGLNLSGETPDFARSRDVDYCSGAALLVRREAVAGELFDPLFVPAYCEDVDLCLRIHAAGYRVRYCHEARVLHHLSVSTRQGDEQRRVQTSYGNQHRLLEKWGDRLADLSAVRALAFYLPQFHPCPENDLWWGKGFTEWRNVAKAQPKYEGHYQPHLPADLGFYDLRIPEVMGEQYRLAQRYGIEGFCVYRYDFSGQKILSAPLENLLKRPDIAFPFCVCWANENWTKHWDGGERALLLAQDYSEAHMRGVAEDAAQLAQDPRYIRVNGKPLFLLYRPLLVPDPALFACLTREAFAAAGHDGVHLVYVESMEAVRANVRPADIGFDAAVEFPPHGIGVLNDDPTPSVGSAWQGHRYDYAETVRAAIARPGAAYPRYPGVFVSWDNTPRQPDKGTSFDGATPARFQAYCEAKIAEAKALHFGEERLLFINAWNEWAEGAHLEPDAVFGHRWLQAFERALAGAKARPKR